MWPDWSFSGFGSEPPETQLLGINKIIAAFYEMPLVILAIGAGFRMIFAGAHLYGRSQGKHEAEHKRHRELVLAQMNARQAARKNARHTTEGDQRQTGED